MGSNQCSIINVQIQLQCLCPSLPFDISKAKISMYRLLARDIAHRASGGQILKVIIGEALNHFIPYGSLTLAYLLLMGTIYKTILRIMTGIYTYIYIHT